MKLDLIKLTNFRQFYGEQTIRLSRDPARNVTVITGVNGAGKTSLLMALRWCLYGLDTESIGELICKRALTETAVGFNIETKVQVVFRHDGEQYTATRVLRANRLSEKDWERDAESELSLTRIRSDGQFETIRNSTGRIESILPSSVSPYFFFDGEKIDQFARPGHEEQVKSGIRNVLKIEVLERAGTHLASVAREYQRELKKQVSGKLQTLLDNQEGLQDDLEKQRKRLSELRGERSAAQRQVREIDERLGQIAETRRWDEQRRQLTTILGAKEQEKQRLWIDIREVTNRSFVSLAGPALAKALAILDQKRERGEIPPGIREQFIQDLLAQKRCVCGRPIIENSEEHRQLLQLLSKSVSSELESAVIQTAGDLRALLSGSDDVLEQIRTKMRGKAAIDADLESLTQELDEISRHLQQFDHEEVAGLEKKRMEWNEQIMLLAGEIGRVEERVERLRADLDGLEKDVDKAEVSERKARALQRRFSLASKAADALDRMCDVFATDMRQSIQSEAKAIFHRLIWKDSQFQDIRLSEDYHLEVYDRWGLPARRELSAGERQVLSLAFITGMSKVAGEEAPLMMDTPFGRLSSSHRENITKQIPELATQLILLVTDEELHSQARNNLVPRIGAEYELVFDQATGSTSVKQLK